jgi:hypothetical protein
VSFVSLTIVIIVAVLLALGIPLTMWLLHRTVPSDVSLHLAGGPAADDKAQLLR